MSLFRPERLCLSVEPDRLAVLRCRGGFRPRIEAERLIMADVGGRQPAAFGASLEAALADFPGPGRAVDVVLSDLLVKSFVFQGVPGLRRLDELRAAIRARFEENFGLPAEAWEISADLTPGARGYLVCAIARDFRDALKQAFAARGLVLASLRPFFVSEFNRWRHRLGRGSAWFAVAGRHSLSLAWFERGGWSALRTYRPTGEPLAALPALLRLERLAYGAPDSAPLCLAGLVEGEGVAATDPPSAAVHLGRPLWPGRSAQWSRDYRLALSGLWP